MAGDAFAAEKPFEIKIVGRTTATYSALEDDDTTAETTENAVTVVLMVESAQPIPVLIAEPIAIDRNGFVLFQSDPDGEVPDNIKLITVMDRPIADYPMRTGKKRQLEIVITQEPDSDDATKGKIVKVVIEIAAGIPTTDPTVLATDGTDTKLNESKLVQHTITLSKAVDTRDVPKVVSIQRLRPSSQTVVSAFQEERIAPAPFNVRIVLTEHPNGIDLADVNNLVEVENGTVSNLVVGTQFTRLGVDLSDINSSGNADFPYNTIRPYPLEGMYTHQNNGPFIGVPQGEDSVTVPFPTSDDKMYRQYRVTITPHTKSADFDVKVRVKSFHDNGAVLRNTYVPVAFADSAFLPNGRDILTIPVKGTARNLTAGYRVVLPKDIMIPAGGYLVVAKDEGGSEVVVPAGKKNEAPKATERTPAQMLYNVIAASTLPNLATAFLNGVVVDLESQHAGLVISEVMWGEDVSLNPSSKSQYIELYNPGAAYLTVDDADHTPAINEAVTLIFYAPNEFSAVPAKTAVAATATTAVRCQRVLLIGSVRSMLRVPIGIR